MGAGAGGRCEAQIEAVATELALVGASSVLDLGFTAGRSGWGGWSGQRRRGVECSLHVLEVGAELR